MVGYGIGRLAVACSSTDSESTLHTSLDLDRAERFFARHGAPVVIFGGSSPCALIHLVWTRLAEMPVPRFGNYTLLGCGMWCQHSPALDTHSVGLGTTCSTDFAMRATSRSSW